MLTKEQAIEILERFDFFQGQRAGRELWNDKPFDVQEQDIANFSRDVALLKEYINDSVPKSTLEGLAAVAQRNIESANERAEKFMAESEKTRVLYENARSKVAREIFEEIERNGFRDRDYDGELLLGIYAQEYDELKKKYTDVTDINVGHKTQSDTIKEFAERVKLEFYREFDEIIPSIMADKIDALVAEIMEETSKK